MQYGMDLNKIGSTDAIHITALNTSRRNMHDAIVTLNQTRANLLETFKGQLSDAYFVTLGKSLADLYGWEKKLNNLVLNIYAHTDAVKKDITTNTNFINAACGDIKSRGTNIIAETVTKIEEI